MYLFSEVSSRRITRDCDFKLAVYIYRILQLSLTRTSLQHPGLNSHASAWQLIVKRYKKRLNRPMKSDIWKIFPSTPLKFNCASYGDMHENWELKFQNSVDRKWTGNWKFWWCGFDFMATKNHLIVSDLGLRMWNSWYKGLWQCIAKRNDRAGRVDIHTYIKQYYMTHISFLLNEHYLIMTFHNILDKILYNTIFQVGCVDDVYSW